MQTTMTLEACCRCGQSIAPGEPAMQTASVDLDMNGRAFSSPVRHTTCGAGATTNTRPPRPPAGRP